MPQLNSTKAAEVRRAGEENARFGGAMPEGKYRVKLTEVTAGQSKSSGNPMWTWQFEVVEFLDKHTLDVDGETKAEREKAQDEYSQALAEREIRYYTTISDKTLWDLDRVFAAFEAEPDTDTDDLIGDNIVVYIGQEIIGAGKRKGQMGNVINDFFTLKDGLPAATDMKKAEQPNF